MKNFRSPRLLPTLLFFGCGGVSSAIACKLAPQLKTIGLVETDEGRKEKLAGLLKELYPSLTVVVFDRKGALDFSAFDIFYNGTGLGKYGKDPDSLRRTPLMEGDIFPETGLAIDANYTPWETVFLRHFADRGFTTLNGASHMRGGTALHLSRISGKKVEYRVIKNCLTLE